MSDSNARLDRLYDLLPLLHRARDQEQGQPLRALLQVIAEQVDVVEDDIAALYDNWFIETCADWVVPYIGDLIGYEPVHEAGEPGDADLPCESARDRILLSRRDVANTIRYRRRKGTLALLELLARDVAGWPARAVEFDRLLVDAQATNQPRRWRGRTLDLRSADALDGIAGPFDRVAHVVDMRHVAPGFGRGRYALGNVGLFVWRLRAQSITRTRPHLQEKAGDHCFVFSPLGNDAPLFIRPIENEDASAIGTERNVPAVLKRHVLQQTTVVGGHVRESASPDYYGLVPGTAIGQSLAIWAEDWAGQPGGGGDAPIPAELIVPGDLTDWRALPPRGHVAVDPVLGRFAFALKEAPKGRLWVSFHQGFSADMGGGEYERPLAQMKTAELRRVHGRHELRRELEPWHPVDGHAPEGQPQDVVIEIDDSGVYVLPIRIHLAAGHTLQIRAAQHARPVIRLLDWENEESDDLRIMGEAGSRFTLDGVVVTGRGVRIEGELASFTVRHSTLVPGWSLEPDCEPWRPAEASIKVIDCGACVLVERSIVGSIQVNNNEIRLDPIPLRITDSIVDATGSDCEGPRCEAIGASDSGRAHATLEIARSTVIGRVMVHRIALAENTIFTSRVDAARTQAGCVRFCYVPRGSRTPRRFECQPDLVEAAAAPEDVTAERNRVRPRFTSLRYGTPGYCQLAEDCAPEISGGADDDAEMGAFHQLFQPQRLANLRARLAEYVPAGSVADVILAT